jgi:Zn-dependent peptidase ImmA (M78 family)
MISLGVDFLPYERIVDDAARFLRESGYQDAIPVPIEYIVEAHLHLDIIPVPNLLRDFDVDGYTSHDLTSIYVDESVFERSPSRYRFTLAHEVGHIVLHKEYFRRLHFGSVTDWKHFLEDLDPNDHSKLEYQGYTFGGLVLVPPEHLRGRFLAAMDTVNPLVEQARAKGLTRNQYADYAVAAMAEILKDAFQVSTDVMIRRIGKDDLSQFIP